jgi:hypothetical protein
MAAIDRGHLATKFHKQIERKAGKRKSFMSALKAGKGLALQGGDGGDRQAAKAPSHPEFGRRRFLRQ